MVYAYRFAHTYAPDTELIGQALAALKMTVVE